LIDFDPFAATSDKRRARVKARLRLTAEDDAGARPMAAVAPVVRS
jgi:hypothetical protein